MFHLLSFKILLWGIGCVFSKIEIVWLMIFSPFNSLFLEQIFHNRVYKVIGAFFLGVKDHFIFIYREIYFFENNYIKKEGELIDRYHQRRV